MPTNGLSIADLVLHCGDPPSALDNPAPGARPEWRHVVITSLTQGNLELEERYVGRIRRTVS